MSSQYPSTYPKYQILETNEKRIVTSFLKKTYIANDIFGYQVCFFFLVNLKKCGLVCMTLKRKENTVGLTKIYRHIVGGVLVTLTTSP